MSAIIKSFSFLQYFVGNWFPFLCAVQITCEDVMSVNSTYQTTGYDRPVKFVTILLFFFYDRPDSVVTKARKQKSWRVELFLESDGILKESDRIHDWNLQIPTVWLLDLGCNPIVSWKQTFINSKLELEKFWQPVNQIEPPGLRNSLFRFHRNIIVSL
jgi:hypothetical protein